MITALSNNTYHIVLSVNRKSCQSCDGAMDFSEDQLCQTVTLAECSEIINEQACQLKTKLILYTCVIQNK